MIAVLILAAILGAAGRLVWNWGQQQNARPIEHNTRTGETYRHDHQTR